MLDIIVALLIAVFVTSIFASITAYLVLKNKKLLS
jgi:hypothetical protein